jgi:hypothetical protein
MIDKAVARGELAPPAAQSTDPSLAPVLSLRAARTHLGIVDDPESTPEICARLCAASRTLAAITPPTIGEPINEGENTMARGSQKAQPKIEEVKAPDFERAVKIFRHDIKPANEKSGEHAQAASTAYKAIKKECGVNTRAAKFVFQLAGESEEKRNDVLRSIRGLLGAMSIGITDDLVSSAEGEDNEAALIPTAPREKLELVTV